MDYERVYRDLIADRRARPPGEDEYVERHHILPRCMGGGDDPDNLIRLRPEDHFFAHLVLAKAYGAGALWASVWVMLSARDVRKRGSWRWLRKEYAWFASRRPAGENHPRADLEKHTFYHHDGRVFVGTRIAFSEATNIPGSHINQVVAGKGMEVFGWSLTKTTTAERAKKRTAVASRSGKQLRGFVRDWKMRHFYHRDRGISVLATQTGMGKFGYLTRKTVCALVNGQSLVRDGWCLAENADTAYERVETKGGESRRDPKTYRFVNSLTGATHETTINEMGRRYNNGDSRIFGEVVRGKGWKGWVIDDGVQRDPRIMGLRWRFRHLLHGELVATQREAARLLGLGLMTVSRLVRGDIKATRDGWRCMGPMNGAAEQNS